MNDALRTAMQRADGAGDLDGAGVLRTDSEHPVCGDLLRIAVRVEDGRIADFAWRADGCPATLAVASVTRDAVVGQPLDRAADAVRARLGRLGGLARHETHAESMMVRALTAIHADAVRAEPDERA